MMELTKDGEKMEMTIFYEKKMEKDDGVNEFQETKLKIKKDGDDHFQEIIDGDGKMIKIMNIFIIINLKR